MATPQRHPLPRTEVQNRATQSPPADRLPAGRPAAVTYPANSSPVRDSDLAAAVPRAVRVAAALGWRLLVVVAAFYVIGIIVSYLAAIVVPVAIAVLLAALLAPAVGWLAERRVPRSMATAIVMVGGLVGLGGGLTLVVRTFIRGLPGLVGQMSTTVDAVVAWLATGPLHLSAQDLQGYRVQLIDAINGNQAAITASALTTAATVGQIVTQILLVIFTLIFLLHDGLQIWRFLLGAVPRRVRSRCHVAGRRGLAALVSYVRATAVVAVFDGAAIGIALGFLGVPLAVSLGALVFLGAFIPIIGAVVVGGLAVLIALVANGPISALIVLAVVIGVMQVEGHLLQPLLLGRAVKLHPLAVVLAIATGLLVAGIAGALLAVPLLAVLNSGIRSFISDADRDTDPDEVDTTEPEDTGPDEPGLSREPTLAEKAGHTQPAENSPT